MQIFPILLILLFVISSINQNKKQQKSSGKKAALPKQAEPHREKLPKAAFAKEKKAPGKTPKKKEKKEPATMLPEPDYYTGSMNAKTGEGEDTVHEDGFHGDGTVTAYTPEPEQEAQPRSPLDFSPSGLVNAFVMQEVLTRPCDRARKLYR